MTATELRELDYEVACQVFGWSSEEVELAKLGDAGCVVVYSDPKWKGNVPEYSSDLKSAWEVVTALGMAWLMTGFTTVTVTFYSGDPAKVFKGKGETVPLAICRTALAAARERASEAPLG